MTVEHSRDVLGVPDPDLSRLLAALATRTGEMASRLYEAYAGAYPAAAAWPAAQRAKFIRSAAARFDALLAVAAHDAASDPALADDLAGTGAAAARSGASLPELLLVLRTSRDLVVRMAVELSDPEERAGLSLSLLLTRILPATDALTDAVARGYWAAVMEREAENLARYEHFASHSSNGVYEVDLDGRITFANQALALVVGRRRRELEGSDLASVLRPLDPGLSLEPLLSDHGEGGYHLTMAIERPDGVRRVVSVYSTGRRVDGELVGFQGIVRDETAERDFEQDRLRLSALLNGELRAPLAAIAGMAATLQSHTDELAPAQMQRLGESIRLQAERISRLADDLHALGQLHSGQLRLTPRPVELAGVVEAALASVRRGQPVAVDIEEGITVLVDPRRLEQVIGNLVDNALGHGSPPVAVSADMWADEVVVTVTDHGPGVRPEAVATLFAGERPGAGGGLALVRGLTEAMGGRVWYEAGKGETCFRIAIPTPARGV